MPRTKSQTPIEVFELTIADAEKLLELARALIDTRRRRMRQEIRESIGNALHYSTRDKCRMDRIESDDLLVVIKPGSKLTRGFFVEEELRPVFRQTVVAAASAVETYVFEKTTSLISSALDLPSDELRQKSISLGDVFDVENNYTRRRFGWRRFVRDHLEQQSSTNPDKLQHAFRLVGCNFSWTAVDGKRKSRNGASRSQMEQLCSRRNAIAHSADRVGSGRAHLSLTETEAFVTNAREIVEAIDKLH